MLNRNILLRHFSRFLKIIFPRIDRLFLKYMFSLGSLVKVQFFPTEINIKPLLKMPNESIFCY
jgi:hypothetical protein